MSANPALLISGYTEEGYGAGVGIARFELLADGTVGEQQGQSTAVRNTSFVSAVGAFFLAVEELPQGNVVALDPLTLEVIGRAPTQGADPCHVTFIEPMVWAANYSSGDAAIMDLAGLLDASQAPGWSPEHGAQLLSHPGSGPVVGRQGQSHAHQVIGTPWGSVLVTDLGADRVDEYALVDGSYALLGSAQLPPGTGPRHVVLKGDFMLVTGELDGHLHLLRRTLRDPEADGGNGDYFWLWLAKSVLAKSSQEQEKAEEFYPSHIELSDDGSKLYAAVRGPNTLVVMDVSGLDVPAHTDAAPTPPRFLHQISSAGNWPRHFVLGNNAAGNTAAGPNKIYVANQLSNNVAVFDLDEQGLPGAQPVQLVAFGSPTCVVLKR